MASSSVEATVSDRRMSTVSYTTQSWKPNPLSSEVEEQCETRDECIDNLPVIRSHSGLNIKIYLDRTSFSAPGVVSGLLALDIKSKLRIRNISIEVEGYEMLHNEDKSTFYKQTLVLQGPGLPPSDAVDSSTADFNGYFKARKQRTNFRFGIEIPQAPSSIEFKRCRIVYLVRCVVEVKDGKVAKNLVVPQLFRVNELIKQRLGSNLVASSESQDWGMFSGKGQVVLTAEIEKSQVVAGSPVYVKVNVQNKSRKKITDISVKLICRLKTFQRTENGRTMVPLSFERISVAKMAFPTDLFNFDGYSNRPVVLDICVPNGEASVKTKMIEVSYVVQVTAKSGMSTPITVNVPIEVVHSISLVHPARIKIDEISHFMSLPVASVLTNADEEKSLPLVPADKYVPDSAISLDYDNGPISGIKEAQENHHDHLVKSLDELAAPLIVDLEEAKSAPIAYPVIDVKMETKESETVAPSAPEPSFSHDQILSDMFSHVEQYDD